MNSIIDEKKSEIIGVCLIICVAIFLLLKMKSEEYRLQHEGIYVIGRLIKSSFGSDHGWIYEYEYYYDKKKFIREFNGQLHDSIRNDSLLFFKILPQNPSVCRQVLDTRVPNCYRRFNIKENNWRQIFTCAELDKTPRYH